MENDVFKEFVQECTEKLNSDIPELYEMFFFKIYVKFEVYLSSLFEQYCVGEASGQGFCPLRKLQFENREHLRAVLKGEKQYVEYVKKIQQLSKHIFIDNPFNVIFDVAENFTALEQMIALRNYIAHESAESRKRYINQCLGGGRFISPSQYLVKMNRRVSKSNYTIFVDKMVQISELLLDIPIV